MDQSSAKREAWQRYAPQKLGLPVQEFLGKSLEANIMLNSWFFKRSKKRYCLAILI
jgi:hypothetical protein